MDPGAVAASVERTGRTLLTRNARDFERLQATLSVELYEIG